MNKTLKKRIKSYLWRALGMAFVASGAYVLNIGDIWQIDIKALTSIGVISALGLLVGEVTKLLNPSNE